MLLRVNTHGVHIIVEFNISNFVWAPLGFTSSVKTLDSPEQSHSVWKVLELLSYFEERLLQLVIIS